MTDATLGVSGQWLGTRKGGSTATYLKDFLATALGSMNNRRFQLLNIFIVHRWKSNNNAKNFSTRTKVSVFFVVNYKNIHCRSSRVKFSLGQDLNIGIEHFVLSYSGWNNSFTLGFIFLSPTDFSDTICVLMSELWRSFFLSIHVNWTCRCLHESENINSNSKYNYITFPFFQTCSISSYSKLARTTVVSFLYWNVLFFLRK